MGNGAGNVVPGFAIGICSNFPLHLHQWSHGETAHQISITRRHGMRTLILLLKDVYEI